MKKLLLSLSILITFEFKAQQVKDSTIFDVITLLSGEKIYCRVQDNTGETVTYEIPNGAISTCRKATIKAIKYVDAKKSEEIFNTNLLITSQADRRREVFETDKIYFYGYDFSHFKFVEAKRAGQEAQIKGIIFEIIDLMNADHDEKRMQKFFKKYLVVFDQAIVMKLNTEIKPEKIMGFMRNSIPKDSLQNIVNRYDNGVKSGIGFVQIIETLYRPKKEALVWYVFFDLGSKRILYAKENSNKDADSYHGLATFWKVGLAIGMGEFVNQYRMDYKESQSK